MDKDKGATISWWVQKKLNRMLKKMQNKLSSYYVVWKMEGESQLGQNPFLFLTASLYLCIRKEGFHILVYKVRPRKTITVIFGIFILT